MTERWMDRRSFMATGVAGLAGGGLAGGGLGASVGADAGPKAAPPVAGAPVDVQSAEPRDLFPRVREQTFLNAAGGTPLGAFAEQGIERYLDFIRHGPAGGRGEYFGEVMSGVRPRFAALIGADEDEIGLVECTKAGEQIAIDGLDALHAHGNVVTNDLHFSGSLHNYEGLARSGIDVRVVQAGDAWRVTAERMIDAMDDRTALVAVSLVSNVNGHVEPIAELSEAAHAQGAIVFADVIQAAGAIPIDVRALGIDVAATSSYKWLFGIHGAGFLYVRRELQDTLLPDRLFPRHVRRNYPPWTDTPDPAIGRFAYSPPAAAVRYQPGHVSYLGYAAVYEGLRFIERMGGPEAINRRTAALRARLLDQLDTDRYRVLTPDPARTPILSLQPRTTEGLVDRLVAANVVVSVGGDMERLIRISPAVYNDASDIDRLAEVLAG